MIEQPYVGRYIALEGIDNSGTTTQTARIAELLRLHGFMVLELYEPYSDDPVLVPTGWEVREILEHRRPKPDPLELQRMFVQAHGELVEHYIAPFLAQSRLRAPVPPLTYSPYDKNWAKTPVAASAQQVREGLKYAVLTDRNRTSGLAYGTTDGSCTFDDVMGMQEHAYYADISFLLDVPAKVAATRAEEADIYDKVEFQQKVCRQYRKIGKIGWPYCPNMISVRAEMGIDDVTAQIWAHLCDQLQITDEE